MKFNFIKNNIWMIITFILGTIILTSGISTYENKTSSTVEVSEPYLGEISMFTGNYAPAGWAFCNGQLLSISANQELFSILGTTFGGDGQSSFALPNMSSRVAIHTDKVQSQNGVEVRLLGEKGGSESLSIVLKSVEKNPSGATGVNASVVAGNSTSYENRQESVGVNYIIAVNSSFRFPSRN